MLCVDGASNGFPRRGYGEAVTVESNHRRVNDSFHPGRADVWNGALGSAVMVSGHIVGVFDA